MLTLRLPGVYAPQDDSDLLLTAALAEDLPPDAQVLDLCTGSGRIAVELARQRSLGVTAVDLSRRAVWSAALNARRHRAAVDIHRGDLLSAVAGRRFDLIVANPPYVPSPRARRPHSRSLAWDAGSDGREILDRICSSAADHLTPTGALLVVHSEVCNPRQTVQTLQSLGMDAEIVDRAFIPFGPVMRSRARWLAAQGMIDPAQHTEELVVVRAQQVASSAAAALRPVEAAARDHELVA